MNAHLAQVLNGFLLGVGFWLASWLVEVVRKLVTR
jgi:hypothetical protein